MATGSLGRRKASRKLQVSSAEQASRREARRVQMRRLRSRSSAGAYAQFGALERDIDEASVRSLNGHSDDGSGRLFQQFREVRDDRCRRELAFRRWRPASSPPAPDACERSDDELRPRCDFEVEAVLFDRRLDGIAGADGVEGADDDGQQWTGRRAGSRAAGASAPYCRGWHASALAASRRRLEISSLGPRHQLIRRRWYQDLTVI